MNRAIGSNSNGTTGRLRRRMAIGGGAARATMVALIVAAAIAAVAALSGCRAQEPPLAQLAEPPRGEDDWEQGRALLSQVADGTFAFDDEAFYWLCRHVGTAAARQELLARAADAPTPLRHLLERPGDYRGRIVVVEGILRSSDAFDLRDRPGIGRLHQLEISPPGTRAIATVICTERPSIASAGGGHATGSLVRATAYFLKTRAYRATDGQTGHGVVLVAGGMVRRVSSDAGEAAAQTWELPGWLNEQALIWSIAMLALTWLILRRRTRPDAHSPVDQRGASRIASAARHPASGTDADFAWLSSQSRNNEPTGPKPPAPAKDAPPGDAGD